MSATKLERLLNLTAALLDTPRPLTAEQLRQRVPGYPEEAAAFHRAFERDKDDLRELGIPLRRERVVVVDRETDGYRVPPEEYYLRDPGLAPDELAALHLAARVVRLEGTTEALWKLGGASGAAGGGDLAPDGAAQVQPLAEVPTDRRLPMLFAALVDRHPVRFDYPSGRAPADGTVAVRTPAERVPAEPSAERVPAERPPAGRAPEERRVEERVVDPQRLDFQRGRWYLSGFDRRRGAGRSFRIDRIVGEVDVATGETFERPAQPHPGVRLQPWELGSEPPVMAHMLVDAAQAPWAMHHLGTDAVTERRSDGSIVLALAVVNLDAFRSFVLTFLDHAEVLSPPELRTAMVDWLAGAVAVPEPVAGPDVSGSAP